MSEAKHTPASVLVARLEKMLAMAERDSAKASEARAALPAGSSRARVTSANARWMRKAEYRDLIAAQLREAKEHLEECGDDPCASAHAGAALAKAGGER